MTEEGLHGSTTSNADRTPTRSLRGEGNDQLMPHETANIQGSSPEHEPATGTRDFTVVVPFTPTVPVAATLRRTALPRLTTRYDQTEDPEIFHPAAAMALELCSTRPLQQVKRWHLYTDGTHQRDSTTDSWALVITAEDQEGFSFIGSISALNTDAVRDDDFPANSTTSELTALIWAYAWVYARFHDHPTKPAVTIHADSLVARGFAKGTFQPKHPNQLTQLARITHDLAASVTDLSTDHVRAHLGHPWNELADSLAKRQAKRTDGSPQPEWPLAFHADRERQREWLEMATPEEKAAYPTMTPKGLSAPPAIINAEPHHFVPEFRETAKKTKIEINACTFNARSFVEPKHTGRQQHRKVSRITAIRTQLADMKIHLVGMQESRLPQGTFPADNFTIISSGHDNHNLG